MAHTEQRNYVAKLASNFSHMFNNKKILEVGSLNINGTLRDFFHDCDYTGIDVGDGPGVDIVCPGQEYDAPDETYDVVCSAECFEHNPFWLETFLNMTRVCKKDGLVFFTCATTNRPEHGTSRTSPEASPLTVGIGWDYYRNLTEEDFTSQINFSDYFSDYSWEVNPLACDLYFYGVKR